MAVAKESGDRYMVGIAFRNFGDTAFALGEYEEAKECYQDALVHYKDVSRDEGIAYSLDCLGNVALAMGDYPEAKRYYQQALKIPIDIRTVRASLDVLVGLATLLAHTERGVREGNAALLVERASELVALVLHHPASVKETRERAQRLLDELQAELPPAVFAAAEERGQARDLQATVAELLVELEEY